MKAVIYARYSSHNQKDESIEGRLRECKDFANKNDLLVGKGTVKKIYRKSCV